MRRQVDRDNLHPGPGHIHKIVKSITVRNSFGGHSISVGTTILGLILQQGLGWLSSFIHWKLEQPPKFNTCWLQLCW
ncbi:unnamed protein product [Triticum turgidum subsp. durum]|uniref:Uncharacterized protein n=1 Tax=Triticum turgidum subsp. durum TaxID=4567 RepID=A0A9R1RXQ6_TRITD|nr:unnamed protein product [Triticum turgidum subsp. durum]